MELLEVVVPGIDAEVAADRLWVAGAQGVEERELADGSVALRAQVTGSDVGRAAALDRFGACPIGWSLRWVEVPDAPDETWRDHVEPIEIDGPAGFVIRPAWLPPVADGRPEIAIEPGSSFGLGDHPTTRLSASAVRELVVPGARVLDVGCGSGVLAIIAARFGADRVRAIDVSPPAVDATRANAALNGVAGSIEASTTPLADVDGTFDLVVANILAPTLIALAEDLVRVLAASGVLVVSGLLSSAHRHVGDALHPLRVVRRRECATWCALELRR